MPSLPILILALVSITSFEMEMTVESKGTHYLNNIEGEYKICTYASYLSGPTRGIPWGIHWIWDLEFSFFTTAIA